MGTLPVPFILTMFLVISVVFFIVLITLSIVYSSVPLSFLTLICFVFILNIALLTGYFLDIFFSGTLNLGLIISFGICNWSLLGSFYLYLLLPGYLCVPGYLRLFYFLPKPISFGLVFLVISGTGILLFAPMGNFFTLPLTDPGFIFQPVLMIPDPVVISFWSALMFLYLCQIFIDMYYQSFEKNDNKLYRAFYHDTLPIGMKLFYEVFTFYGLVIPMFCNVFLPKIWEEWRQYLWMNFVAIYGVPLFFMIVHLILFFIYVPEHGIEPLVRKTPDPTAALSSDPILQREVSGEAVLSPEDSEGSLSDESELLDSTQESREEFETISVDEEHF